MREMFRAIGVVLFAAGTVAVLMLAAAHVTVGPPRAGDHLDGMVSMYEQQAAHRH